MTSNGASPGGTIKRKALEGKVELEMLTYRPLLTDFVVGRLIEAFGELEVVGWSYAATMTTIQNLTILDAVAEEPEMQRLQEYWDNRVSNPANDFQNFMILVSPDVMNGLYKAYEEVADTFLSDDGEDEDDAKKKSATKSE